MTASDEDAINLAQAGMRIGGELQRVGKHDEIQAMRREWQIGEVTRQSALHARRRRGVVAGEPPMRHAIMAQRLQRRETELQGVKAEHVGHGPIELRLLPFEKVPTRRSLQPFLETYTRADFGAQMHIVALRAFRDNYLWLIHDGRRALVVDPGDAAPVEAACEAQGLELAGILVTHHHHDHTGGIEALVRRRPVPVWGPANEPIPCRSNAVRDGDHVRPPGMDADFAVMHVPGHTLGHVAYVGNGALFCGDTLFSAGCGRLFEGSPAQMLDSLDRLAALPTDTKVHCAHEYTLSNLQFARQVEPENARIATYTAWCEQQRADDAPTLPSTIGQELQVNPFLRVDAEAVRRRLARHAGRAPAGRVEAFTWLRGWKDQC